MQGWGSGMKWTLAKQLVVFQNALRGPLMSVYKFCKQLRRQGIVIKKQREGRMRQSNEKYEFGAKPNVERNGSPNAAKYGIRCTYVDSS